MKISSLPVSFTIFLVLHSVTVYTQNPWIDSLKSASLTQTDDTNKVRTLRMLTDYYAFNNPDLGIRYGKEALALSEKLQYDKGIFWSIVSLDRCLFVSGNYAVELDNALRVQPILNKLNDQYALGWSNGMLCDSYMNLGDYKTARIYARLVMKNIEHFFPDESFSGYANFVPIYIGLHEYDSALYAAKKGYSLLKANPALYTGNSYKSKLAKGQVLLYLGVAFEGKGRYDSALYYYHLGIPINEEVNMKISSIEAFIGAAKSHLGKTNPDSAIWFANAVLKERMTEHYPVGKLKAVNLLADIYESQGKSDSSLKYLRIAVTLKDSLYTREKTTSFQNSLLREQEKRKEIDAATTILQNRYRMYLIITLLIVCFITAIVIVRNKKIRQLQTMRNRIADDLHDDIGSTLSSISIMNELAKAKSPDALLLLTSIGESTSTIQENMSDIVWAIQADSDRFENVLQRMNQFASEILDSKNIRLDFTSNSSVSTSKLTMRQRKHFYFFFKEAINNAVKHAYASQVAVDITKKDHHITLTIRDNGKGFNTATIFQGNGMNSLKRRANELHAHFDITSLEDEGTTICLKFKIT
jgi:signal transduction histidine kinase